MGMLKKIAMQLKEHNRPENVKKRLRHQIEIEKLRAQRAELMARRQKVTPQFKIGFD